ncbi:MAG: DUF2721 domain-containing protein [Aquisalimonadaceae bacterium]
MELTLATPALLFPTVSLLLLAYTNRFLALAALIRDLQARYSDAADPLIKGQIDNLRRRVNLIRTMQEVGAASLFLCVLCMFLLFAGFLTVGKVVFGLSLFLLMVSLGLSVREIHISVHALNLQLGDMENAPGRSRIQP